MPNTYEVVGTCDPDGTLRPYGTTAPKADPDAITAADVSFDNTGTGLSATDVHGAITEVNGKYPTVPNGRYGVLLNYGTAEGNRQHTMMIPGNFTGKTITFNSLDVFKNATSFDTQSLLGYTITEASFSGLDCRTIGYLFAVWDGTTTYDNHIVMVDFTVSDAV